MRRIRRNLFRPLKRKGYFFLMDVIFAIVILTIGYMMIASNRISVHDEVPLALVAENTMDLLSTVNINDLCDSECECSDEIIEDLCTSGKILNKEQSLLDYFGEMKDNDEVDEEKYGDVLFSELINKTIRTDLFNAELVVDGVTLYEDPGRDKSLDLISSKKIGFGFYEDRAIGEVYYWGPYLIEVNIWD